MNVGAVRRPHDSKEPTMETITTIGLDIAKSVFQVHGVDAQGKEIVRRQLKRRYVFGILPKTSALPRWHRSLRFLTLLVARTTGAWAYGAAYAAGLRKALRQAAEERFCRRGGNLRSGHESKHAVRPDEDDRAAELPDAPSHTPSVHPAADGRHQCNPSSLCRVRHCRPGRAHGC